VLAADKKLLTKTVILFYMSQKLNSQLSRVAKAAEKQT
jgi:hypothetical protein